MLMCRTNKAVIKQDVAAGRCYDYISGRPDENVLSGQYHSHTLSRAYYGINGLRG